LSDRYYDAVYWLRNWAINCTRAQVRHSDYGTPPNDLRNGLAETIPLSNLPRLAIRVSLPMAAQMLIGETVFNPISNPNGYDPLNNLMSTGTAVLTAAQVALILSQTAEQDYRRTNWVAVLGSWQRNGPALSTTFLNSLIAKGALSPGGPDRPRNQTYANNESAWMFPAWESDPQTRPLDSGTGLLFLPVGDTTPMHYPCICSDRRGRAASGAIFQPNTIGEIEGKRRLVQPNGTHIDNIIVDFHPNWMCYSRRLLHDLL
jgi:hypothetical protein